MVRKFHVAIISSFIRLAFQLFTPLICEVFSGKLFSCGSFLSVFVTCSHSGRATSLTILLSKSGNSEKKNPPNILGFLETYQYRNLNRTLQNCCNVRPSVRSSFSPSCSLLRYRPSVESTRSRREIFRRRRLKRNRPSHLSYFFSTTIIFVHLIYC